MKPLCGFIHAEQREAKEPGHGSEQARKEAEAQEVVETGLQS